MLTSRTVDTVEHYWSSFLGCPREALSRAQTLVVPHAGLRDYHGLFAFLRHTLLVVSVPPHLLDTWRPQVIEWSPANVMREDRLRCLVGSAAERVVGPAFVGYTEHGTFPPVHSGAVRVLGPHDGTAFAALQAVCSPREWEHGGSQLGEQPVVGAYDGEYLVAVAGYTLWGGHIAHMAVVTHPQYRGQGYGRAVVSGLTAAVLSRGLVPQYRTLEANTPSMALARALGFERYATTVAVRFRPDGT
jgi:GNAT superfamily N-acetyltransferase